MPATNYIIFALNLALHLILHYLRASHISNHDNFFLTVSIGVTKLLVVIIAVRILIQSKEQASQFIWIYWGLILGWFGDLFLYLMDNSIILFGYPFLYYLVPEFFFLAGLACFFSGHVLYVVGFLKDRSIGHMYGLDFPPAKNIIGVSVLLAIYGGTVYYFLYPHIPNELKIPVFGYLLIISTMFVAAFSRPIKMCNRKVLIYGALFFIFSDTILAFSMFVGEFPSSPIIVMLTYGMAQLLIAAGYAQGDRSFE